MNRVDYLKPLTLDEVFEIKVSMPQARYVAGGTDLMVKVKKGELQTSTLISLRSVSELSGIDINEETRIGAMSTITDILGHAQLGERYPALMEAARRMAGVQIRNVATIGGNLCNCSPCADMATPLLVYEASVRLRSSERMREMPLEDFFRGPGLPSLSADEILTDILLPPVSKQTRATFMKKGRVRMDLAIASVSVLLEMHGNECQKARLAAGSVAPIPLRLEKVEKMLERNTITRELLDAAQEQAADMVSPITDVRASEEYRRVVTGVFVKRALEQILGWKQP